MKATVMIAILCCLWWMPDGEYHQQRRRSPHGQSPRVPLAVAALSAHFPAPVRQFSHNGNEPALTIVVGTDQSHDAMEDGQVQSAGTLHYPNFVVRVRALVFAALPPQSVRFRLHREKTGETYYLTGRLAGLHEPSPLQEPSPLREPSSERFLHPSINSDSAPARMGYVYEALWTVTRSLGQWQIAMVSYRQHQRTVTYDQAYPSIFKINKREQIVTLARYWADQKLPTCMQLPTFNGCDGFVDYLYRHLGLPEATLGGFTSRTVIDNNIGATRYYFSLDNDTLLDGANHVGIVSDSNQIIDNNWGSTEAGPQAHGDRDGIDTFYSPDTINCSPRDPTRPGQSLLDTL